MPKRVDLGLDRTPCERCGHRRDMHAAPDEGLLVCIVCKNIGRWPCSPESLELMRAKRG